MVAYRYATSLFALSTMAAASSFTTLIKRTHLDDPTVPTPTETPDYVPDYVPLADDPYYDPNLGTDSPGWSIITDEPLSTDEPTTAVHLTVLGTATATPIVTETHVSSTPSPAVTSSVVPARSSTTHHGPSTTSYLPVDPKTSAINAKEHHKNLVVTMTLVATAVCIAVGIIGLTCGLFIYKKIRDRKTRNNITEIIPARTSNSPSQSPKGFAASARASAFNTQRYTLGLGGRVTPIESGMDDIELDPIPILHDPRVSGAAQRERSASRHSEMPVMASRQERIWWQGSVSRDPAHSLRPASSQVSAFPLNSRRPTRAGSLAHWVIPTGSTTLREEPVSPLSEGERRLFGTKSSRNPYAVSVASKLLDSFEPTITPVTVTSHGRVEEEYVPPRQGWSAL